MGCGNLADVAVHETMIASIRKRAERQAA